MGFFSFLACREHHFWRWSSGHTFRPSSVPTKISFATRNAQYSACEVSACSVLTDTNVPRGCAPIQPSTARLGHQIRCVCASSACLGAQQDPASTAQVDDAWWSLWLDSCPQVLNSGARAGTMRGRVRVIFQGRGFESHCRGILQFYFHHKRGRIGSKIFAVTIMKSAA